MMPHPLLAYSFNLTFEYFQPILQLAGRLVVPAHFDRPAAAAASGWQRNELRLGKALFNIDNFCMIEAFADISTAWRTIDHPEYILALVADA